MKRVVITGMGTVNPVGCNVSESWTNITESRSGICSIRHMDVEDLSSKIAGMVPSERAPHTFASPFVRDDYVSDKEAARMDIFSMYAIAAAAQACHQAGIETLTDGQRERAGVSIGSGIGGLPWIEDTVHVLRDKGARRVSPFFLPACLINLAAGHVSIRHKLYGPNVAVVTACATGTHAICDAVRMIRSDEADVMVCGGAESAICRIAIAGFGALKALSSHYNDRPTEASRPWDKARDGFVIGEGAGILVLESYDHAKARGAEIMGEIVGYGLSSDANHVTAPCPDGSGAYSAMYNALRMSHIAVEEIGYVNAHGTSTGIGDLAELRAVEKLFGGYATKLAMSSTKSAIGHLLGASGAVEAIFALMALRTGILPPTLNLHDPEETEINLIPLKAQEKKIHYAMSNSFGFGGTNCSVIFKACV